LPSKNKVADENWHLHFFHQPAEFFFSLNESRSNKKYEITKTLAVLCMVAPNNLTRNSRFLLQILLNHLFSNSFIYLNHELQQQLEVVYRELVEVCHT
jgi:hypothetical protein